MEPITELGPKGRLCPSFKQVPCSMPFRISMVVRGAVGLVTSALTPLLTTLVRKTMLLSQTAPTNATYAPPPILIKVVRYPTKPVFETISFTPARIAARLPTYLKTYPVLHRKWYEYRVFTVLPQSCGLRPVDQARTTCRLCGIEEMS
jgi:hypothetical protein